MYKLVIRPLLFLFPPEFIHNLSFYLIKIICKVPFMAYILKIYFSYNNKSLHKKMFNLNFKNSIGLAAGFDKNALLIKELSLFGFGHIEIGTVTPKPQNGNKKPRLFRLNSEKSLINRMGFNNDGVEIIAKRLVNLNADCIIGANIGKNKDTPNSEALNDYKYCFIKLHPYVDYFAINLSSPNTEGLRELQEKKNLRKILSGLKKLNLNFKIQKPILFGVDVVLHSATKYFGGHSDISAGAVAASQAHIDKIWNLAKNLGGNLSDYSVWLLERSMKTLSIRVKAQQKNAKRLAKYLSESRFVKKVYYPGLKNHPNHNLAKKQMKGFGAMISFEFIDKIDPSLFLTSLNLIKPSMSLAGVESTMLSPAETSHYLLTEKERLSQGITNELIRFSVGIENKKDIIMDIEHAIKLSIK